MSPDLIWLTLDVWTPSPFQKKEVTSVSRLGSSGVTKSFFLGPVWGPAKACRSSSSGCSEPIQYRQTKALPIFENASEDSGEINRLRTFASSSGLAALQSRPFFRPSEDTFSLVLKEDDEWERKAFWKGGSCVETYELQLLWLKLYRIFYFFLFFFSGGAKRTRDFKDGSSTRQIAQVQCEPSKRPFLLPPDGGVTWVLDALSTSARSYLAEFLSFLSARRRSLVKGFRARNSPIFPQESTIEALFKLWRTLE